MRIPSITSRKRRHKRLQERLGSDPVVVVDKLCRTIPVALDNSSTFRGGSSYSALVDVSGDVRGERDSAGESVASVECVQ
jgi:hypothetical protein